MDELTWQGFRKPTATTFITGVIMDRTFSDLKPGDEVFVVWQQQRHSYREQRRETVNVSKIGRKYGYIKAGSVDRPFSLITGQSEHHEDNYARANGFGFDVYLTESDFVKKQHNDREYARLVERIRTHFGIANLSPQVVQKIHAVLDEFNEGNPRDDK